MEQNWIGQKEPNLDQIQSNTNHELKKTIIKCLHSKKSQTQSLYEVKLIHNNVTQPIK